MPDTPPRKDRPTDKPSKGSEEVADLARGANGLGDAVDWSTQAEPGLHLMRASVAGAMAMSLGAAAFTLESMARMMSFGAGKAPQGDGDDIEGIEGPASPVRRTRGQPKNKK